MDGSDLPMSDELELVVVVDNETDTLSSIDKGLPQLPEVVSLIADLVISPSTEIDPYDLVDVDVELTMVGGVAE